MTDSCSVDHQKLGIQCEPLDFRKSLKTEKIIKTLRTASLCEKKKKMCIRIVLGQTCPNLFPRGPHFDVYSNQVNTFEDKLNGSLHL